MTDVAREDLRWMTTQEEPDSVQDTAGPVHTDPSGLESLRSAFVEAFNARDLESIMELVSDDVEFGDPAVEGRADFAQELAAIWERSPDVMLTRGFDDEGPCAVAWRPDEVGGWARIALLCFDVTEDDLIAVVEMPDDAEVLTTAVAEDPEEEELDEWLEWDRDAPGVGETTHIDIR